MGITVNLIPKLRIQRNVFNVSFFILGTRIAQPYRKPKKSLFVNEIPENIFKKTFARVFLSVLEVIANFIKNLSMKSSLHYKLKTFRSKLLSQITF